MMEDDCFELPWPTDWTLWIVLAIGIVIGFCAGWVIT